MVLRRPLPLALTIGLLAAGGCGDGEATTETQTPATNTTATDQPRADDHPDTEHGSGEVPPPSQDKPSGPVESGAGDPRVTALERAAARAVRSYVAALDARDGAEACALLAPGALQELKLPKPRGSCEASLEASIGYRDPRGLPVWEGAQIAELRSLELGGETAKAVATVITEFADRPEPSIEDDIVYLQRDGARWLIAKPSSTLYRAVGIADVPPSVLTPP